MKKESLFRRFPKFALMAVVFFGSTIAFVLWWWQRSAESHEPGQAGRDGGSPALDLRADSLPGRMDRLFLAGSDLYDSETGELIFKNWLNGDKPHKLYYESTGKKLIGQFERGMARYGLDGTREAELTAPSGINISTSFKEALFARENDMWRADVDWRDFKLTNERRVTKLGNLNESFMLQNVMLASGNYLVLREQNQLLRINTATGDVTPVHIPLNDLKRGRSADGAVLMGDISERGGRKVFAYNVEKDDAVFEDVGRNRSIDYCWMDAGRCVVMIGGDTLKIYDRDSNGFSAVCALPVPCQRLMGPSPDGRYIFAANRRGMLLVDTKEKSAEIWTDPVENLEWITGDRLLICQDVPDSGERGTWIKQIGRDRERVAPEPYVTARDGEGALLPMPEAGWIIFTTRDRLFRVDLSGENLKELAAISGPVLPLQAISGWGKAAAPRR